MDLLELFYIPIRIFTYKISTKHYTMLNNFRLDDMHISLLGLKYNLFFFFCNTSSLLIVGLIISNFSSLLHLTHQPTQVLLVQILCLVAYRSYNLGLFEITSLYTGVHWFYRYTPNIYSIFLYVLCSLFSWSSRSNLIIGSAQPSCVCLYKWYKFLYKLLYKVSPSR